MENLFTGTFSLGTAFALSLGMALVIVTDPRVIDKYLNPGRKKRRRQYRPRSYGSPVRHYTDEE